MPLNMEAQQLVMNAFNNQMYATDQVDVQHTPLYDTITYAAAASITETNSAFFTSVGPASSKTLAQSNMTQANRLPAPEAFAVFSYRLRWAENIQMSDALNILNGFAYQFYVNQKQYQTAPLWHFPAGGGPFTAGLVTGIATPPALATTSTNNGVPTREAILRLAITLSIENQATFGAGLKGNAFTLAASGGSTLGTGLILVNMLDGLYARAIQ